MHRLLVSAVAVLASLAPAAPAAAYGPPQMRLRELDVSDRPVGPWRVLDGAQLRSANGFELGVVLERSGQHVLVEVTAVPAGTSIDAQREVYDLCFEHTGTPGEVVDLDQRIRYAGNGTYGVRMTVSDSPDASSACTTANPATAQGTFGVDARTTIRRVGAPRLVLDLTDDSPAFGGWAVDPPDLAGSAQVRCTLGGGVTQTLTTTKDPRLPGEPYAADFVGLSRPGRWTCAGRQSAGGALIPPAWSEPIGPELVREAWYGLSESVPAGRARNARVSARMKTWHAGATVRMRLRRAMCGRRLRTVTATRAKVSPSGRLVFRFRLPKLRRHEDFAIYRPQTTISGAPLVVSRPEEEDTLALTRDGLQKTLSACDGP